MHSPFQPHPRPLIHSLQPHSDFTVRFNEIMQSKNRLYYASKTISFRRHKRFLHKFNAFGKQITICSVLERWMPRKLKLSRFSRTHWMHSKISSFLLLCLPSGSAESGALSRKFHQIISTRLRDHSIFSNGARSLLMCFLKIMCKVQFLLWNARRINVPPSTEPFSFKIHHIAAKFNSHHFYTDSSQTQNPINQTD